MKGKKNRMLIEMEEGVITNILSTDPDMEIDIITYDEEMPEEDSVEFRNELSYYQIQKPDGIYTEEDQKELSLCLKNKREESLIHEITFGNLETVDYVYFDNEAKMMTESDQDHVQHLLKEGYLEGELHHIDEDTDEPIFGWWKKA